MKKQLLLWAFRRFPGLRTASEDAARDLYDAELDATPEPVPFIPVTKFIHEDDDIDDLPFSTGGYTESKRKDFARMEAPSLTAEVEANIVKRLQEHFKGTDLAALLARDGLCLYNELQRMRAK